MLVHGPADGAWNMAVDEALLDSYADAPAGAPPTLRLYGWSPPALSLGRGQVASDSRDPDFLRRHGIDLVRRLTGGLAVLHDEERTYALIGSLRREPFPGGVVDTYRRVASALVAAMRGLGVEAAAKSGGGNLRTNRREAAACFAATGDHEIEVRGRKLIGSAQVRRRAAFLQHGSILLTGDPQRLSRAIGRPVAPRFTGLRQLLAGPVEAGEVDRAVCRAFEERFGIELAAGFLTDDERARAERLRGFKHLSTDWVLHGRSG